MKKIKVDELVEILKGFVNSKSVDCGGKECNSCVLRDNDVCSMLVDIDCKLQSVKNKRVE